MSVIPSAIRTLASAWPWPVDPSDELRRAAAWSSVPIDPDAVVRAGYVAGAPFAVAVAALGLWLRLPPLALPPLGAVGWLVTTHAVHRAPVLAAHAGRTRAVGETGPSSPTSSSRCGSTR
ncbi:MAG: hypothetical protein ABEH47_07260 [Haloferacaceae archaeon]